MEREQDIAMSKETNEDYQKPRIIVERIADGLNFGDGSIALAPRLESDSDDLETHNLHAVETLIESGDILLPIEKDSTGRYVEDDGCGDGRSVLKTFKGLAEKARSLVRAKVFGGGVTMGVASDIGLGKANGMPLESLFGSVIEKFKGKDIDFGAHTDNHAEGDKSGCGAIDNAPVIISNVGRYQDSIVSVIGGVLGEEESRMATEVAVEFQKYSDNTADQSYSGKNVMAKIRDEAKVVKELEGPHKEIVIILNDVEGYSVDQEAVRRVTGGRGQAFAVDLWRLKEIAAKYYEGEAERQKGFVSMIVYTLATAGTLTKGDLPVYLVSAEQAADNTALEAA